MTTAAVIGLGTMGPGIAATLCRGGMKVTAFDVSAEQRAKAPQSIKTATAVLANLGMPDRSNGAEVQIGDSLEASVNRAGLVVETSPEQLDVNATVLQAIDEAVRMMCL